MTTKEQPQETGRQRLDKWLFFTRMVKSRALAQSYIRSGNVTVNGTVVRQSSYNVKIGDTLTLAFERMDLILIVKAAGERRGPYEEARHLYEDQTPPRDPKDAFTPLEQAVRQPGSGRPTKKERRAIDRFIAEASDSDED